METLVGAVFDSLMGGAHVDSSVRAVKISSDTTVERGMLLAGVYDGSDVTVHIATAADATNGSGLFIAYGDDSNDTVTVAYDNGLFNRSAIKLSEGLDIGNFELEMRRQGLLLTEVI